MDNYTINGTEPNISIEMRQIDDYMDVMNRTIEYLADKRWWNDEWFNPIAILTMARDYSWDLPSAMMLFLENPWEVGFTMHGIDEGYGDPMYHEISLRQQDKWPYEPEKRDVKPLEVFADLFKDNPDYEGIKARIFDWDGYGTFDT